MTIQDRAAKVLQEIDAALALAKKATPGPWKQGRYDFETNRIYAAYAKQICDCPTNRAAEFTDDSRFIATARTLLPASLRCLKTAIDGLLLIVSDDKRAARELANHFDVDDSMPPEYAPAKTLTTLCDQWEAGR